LGPVQAGHQPLHANIQLGWSGLTVSNTLAYTATSTAVKCFVAQAKEEKKIFFTLTPTFYGRKLRLFIIS